MAVPAASIVPPSLPISGALTFNVPPSADSIETAEVSDSEITLHFQDIEIAVDTGKQAVQNAITFSGGLEVQSGASLTLGNNVPPSATVIKGCSSEPPDTLT